MNSCFLYLCIVALSFGDSCLGRVGARSKARPAPAEHLKQHTGAAWSRRLCRNRHLFSLTPPVLRSISRAEPRDLSRSSFSATPIAPISVPCTWRIVGAALKKVPSGIADQVKLVFVTTDPARDTPVELRRWLDNFDKHFVGLTGTEAAIEAVQRAAGVPADPQNGARNGNYSVCARQFCCRVHERQSGPRDLSWRGK